MAKGKKVTKGTPPADPPGVICEFCGAKIPSARVKALPGVTTCVSCADKHPKPLDPNIIATVQESIDCVELDFGN